MRITESQLRKIVRSEILKASHSSRLSGFELDEGIFDSFKNLFKSIMKNVGTLVNSTSDKTNDFLTTSTNRELPAAAKKLGISGVKSFSDLNITSNSAHLKVYFKAHVASQIKTLKFIQECLNNALKTKSWIPPGGGKSKGDELKKWVKEDHDPHILPIHHALGAIKGILTFYSTYAGMKAAQKALNAAECTKVASTSPLNPGNAIVCMAKLLVALSDIWDIGGDDDDANIINKEVDKALVTAKQVMLAFKEGISNYEKSEQ